MAEADEVVPTSLCPSNGHGSSLRSFASAIKGPGRRTQISGIGSRSDRTYGLSATEHPIEEADVSGQAVKVVEDFLAAVKRRDMSAAMALLDADVEWVAPRSLPYGGTFHGPREVAEGYFGGFLEHVDDDFELIVDELIDAEDRVVGRLRLRGHGRLSGKPFDVPAVDVLAVRDGKVSRLEYHIDTVAILHALELPAAV
jgi:hypothetical protein